MRCLVLLFRSRPDLTFEEFRRYWHEEHVPLVLRVPGIRRYETGVVVASPDGSPRYHGVAQLWFDDAAALHHALNTDATRATGRDAHAFIEKGSIVRLVTEPRTILGGRIDLET